MQLQIRNRRRQVGGSSLPRRRPEGRDRDGRRWGRRGKRGGRDGGRARGRACGGRGRRPKIRVGERRGGKERQRGAELRRRRRRRVRRRVRRRGDGEPKRGRRRGSGFVGRSGIQWLQGSARGSLAAPADKGGRLDQVNGVHYSDVVCVGGGDAKPDPKSGGNGHVTIEWSTAGSGVSALAAPPPPSSGTAVVVPSAASSSGDSALRWE